MITDKKPIIDDTPKLFGSCRFVLAIYCLFAVTHVFYMRFNFSMAIVCMKGTKVNGSDTSTAIDGEFEHWDLSIISNLLGSFFYGYISTQVIGGRISDKFGSKYSLIGGMLGLSITSMLIPELTR